MIPRNGKFDQRRRDRWERKQEAKMNEVKPEPSNGNNYTISFDPIASFGGIRFINSSVLTGTAMEEPKKEKTVLWSDIIGLEDAKTALREAIEQPYLHAEVYKHFNIKPPKGVLLYGPPGCGKTMLGKAAAASMAEVHKKPQMDGFFYFNGAEMMGPYVGDEGKWVRQCFAKADEFSKRNGFPAILFFDECDSMLPDRKHSPRWVVEGVNTFLSLMDGMNPCNAFIILATNNHECLDEAAVRAGRIDKKIFVGRPEKPAVLSILRSTLAGKPMTESLDSMADYAAAQLFAESRVVGDKELYQLLNGAMVVSVIERAALLAFKKAIQSGTKDLSTLGIGLEEIRESVDAVHQEAKSMAGEATPAGQVRMTAETTITIERQDSGDMSP